MTNKVGSDTQNDRVTTVCPWNSTLCLFGTKVGQIQNQWEPERSFPTGSFDFGHGHSLCCLKPQGLLFAKLSPQRCLGPPANSSHRTICAVCWSVHSVPGRNQSSSQNVWKFFPGGSLVKISDTHCFLVALDINREVVPVKKFAWYPLHKGDGRRHLLLSTHTFYGHNRWMCKPPAKRIAKALGKEKTRWPFHAKITR